MNRLGRLFAAFVLSMVGFNICAADIKIGVVDLQKIMQTSPQVKEIQKKLEITFKPRRDKLVAAETALKAKMEQFKRDSAILSATQKREAEKSIVTGQQQIERDGQQYQQEYNSTYNEAIEEFYAKVKAAIVKVAKEGDYATIVREDAAPYGKDDVTEKVMKAIS